MFGVLKAGSSGINLTIPEVDLTLVVGESTQIDSIQDETTQQLDPIQEVYKLRNWTKKLKLNPCNKI